MPQTEVTAVLVISSSWLSLGKVAHIDSTLVAGKCLLYLRDLSNYIWPDPQIILGNEWLDVSNWVTAQPDVDLPSRKPQCLCNEKSKCIKIYTCIWFAFWDTKWTQIGLQCLLVLTEPQFALLTTLIYGLLLISKL